MASIFGNLGSLFSPDSAPINKARKAITQGANQAYSQGIKPINEAYNKGIGFQQQALPQWQQIFGQGTAMSPFYMGGLGIGTPAQNTAAQSAFMGSIPGQEYQNQLPDIYEAALRRGGLTGQTGQIPIDLTNETMKALNQFYQPWQSALNPLPYESAGATGETGVFNTETNLAGHRGDVASGLAVDRANAVAQANANAIAQRYQQGQAAGQTTLSTLFGLGGLALAPFTGGASLAGMGMSGLKNLFSSSSLPAPGTPSSYQAAFGEPGVGGVTTNLGYF